MTAKSKTRGPPKSYRPPREREAEFDARVAASGLSVNGFITEAVFGRTRHRPAELRMLARLLGKAAHISEQLHEASRAGNTDSAPLIEAACRDLTEIRAALLEAMGRKP